MEYLLSAAADANSAQLALVAAQPSPVCGNGICETGERPGGNSTSSLSSGQLHYYSCLHNNNMATLFKQCSLEQAWLCNCVMT